MASADEVGHRVGRYRLLFRAGSGGMGEVFVAERRDGPPGEPRIVALKRLLPRYADAAPYLASLREEARLAALVRHPNVCQVLELVEEPGERPALVLEYLEGVPLRRLAAPDAAVELVVGLFVQACDGVHAVHELAGADGRPLGVVHRDLNPSNMIATPDGTLKILDFGVARADDAAVRTRTGEVKGTTPYLAPEQVLGRPLDRRADVFALGVTLFELLTGASPFRRENEFLTQRAITDEDAPSLLALRPDAPPALAVATALALARDPAGRFATAAALGRAAAAALAALPPRRALGDAITRRFGPELAERRRRVERGVEAIDAIESRPLGPITVRTAATAPAAGGPPRASAVGGRIGVAAATVLAGALAWFGWARSRGSEPSLAPAGPRGAAPADPAPVATPPSADVATAPAAATPPSAGAATAPAVAVVPGAPAPAIETARGRPAPRSTRTSPPVAPAGPPGYLTIASRPYATIFVDGKRIGVTPLYKVALPPGRRRIRAECSCGKRRSLVVTVRSGLAAPPLNLTW